MAKTPYGSPSKAVTDNLISFYDMELGNMANELTDVLSPAIASMQAVQIVLEMQIELADYIKKNGKNDRLHKSAKRLFKLFDLIAAVNKEVGIMNTLKLRNREINVRLLVMQKENAELKSKLHKIEQAENF